MTRVAYHAFRRRKVVPYTCTTCGKAKRKVISAEHTVNPWGHADAKSAVAGASAAVRERAALFLAEPYCQACWQSMSFRAQQDAEAARKAKRNQEGL